MRGDTFEIQKESRQSFPVVSRSSLESNSVFPLFMVMNLKELAPHVYFMEERGGVVGQMCKETQEPTLHLNCLQNPFI